MSRVPLILCAFALGLTFSLGSALFAAPVIPLIESALIGPTPTESGGSGSPIEGGGTGVGGSATADIDMGGYKVYDTTDALELGTACTGGGTGDVCTGADLYVEGALDVTGAMTMGGRFDLDAQNLYFDYGSDPDNFIGWQSANVIEWQVGGQWAMVITQAATMDINFYGARLHSSAGDLVLGDSCTSGHSLAAGDVCVGDKMEVDGMLYADGGITTTGQSSYTVYAPACAPSTDDFDIDWSNGNIAHLDLEDCDQDANDVNAPTNPTNYTSYVITIEQSTAGTEDLTWNAVFLFPGGTDPVNTQTNNARDVITCLYVDSVYHCSSALDMQ